MKTQKFIDTVPTVSEGGRLKEYWGRRGTKLRRADFVDWDRREINLTGLADKYKLKGFEFGRYVNNEDRYDFVIAARQSLEDLAELLKTKNIGIEYKIGIAFGARGRGGKAIAHYEPGYNMINLTKNKGGHSMAHEYGHALDYNIGSFVDQNRYFLALSAGRSEAKWPENNTGGTCRLLMRKLIYEIKMTDSYKRLSSASDYWHYNTEVFARFFEQWCCYKLKKSKSSNLFLARSWTDYTSQPQYLTEGDFRKVLPTADKLMRNIGLLLNGRKTDAFIELKVTNPEKMKKAAGTGNQTKPAKKTSNKQTPKTK